MAIRMTNCSAINCGIGLYVEGPVPVDVNGFQAIGTPTAIQTVNGGARNLRVRNLIHHPEPPHTFQRRVPKIGRNDPCPCGSGRKQKKCCGA